MTEAVARAKASHSLLWFIFWTFPAYKYSSHLGEVAARLESVASGACDRLIITMPPRHGKSELASIRFPAFYLGQNPDHRIILASYSADLAQNFSRQVRRIVETPEYAEIFPEIVLAADSRSVGMWDISGRRGGMKATGVGGPLTGFGSDLLLIDDPIKNREEAESETVRESTWDWYTSVARTRLEKHGKIVIILTRWHEDDLVGRLLNAQGTDPQADKWSVLHLPAISDDGHPLWPEKYSISALESIRATIGPRDWESLYQGRPTPPEGSMFKRSQFEVIDSEPEGLRYVRFWDLAASGKESADFTAGAKCGITETGELIISDLYHERKDWPDVEADMAAMVSMEPGLEWGIEQAGFQLAVIQQLQRDPRFYRIPITGVPVDRDKVSRARPWQPRKVKLVRGLWNQKFIAEALSFPLGKHDDMVDAVSGAYQLLAGTAVPRLYGV